MVLFPSREQPVIGNLNRLNGELVGNILGIGNLGAYYSEFPRAGKSPIFHAEFRTLIQIASLTAGAAGVHAM